MAWCWMACRARPHGRQLLPRSILTWAMRPCRRREWVAACVQVREGVRGTARFSPPTRARTSRAEAVVGATPAGAAHEKRTRQAEQRASSTRQPGREAGAVAAGRRFSAHCCNRSAARRRLRANKSGKQVNIRGTATAARTEAGSRSRGRPSQQVAAWAQTKVHGLHLHVLIASAHGFGDAGDHSVRQIGCCAHTAKPHLGASTRPGRTRRGTQHATRRLKHPAALGAAATAGEDAPDGADGQGGTALLTCSDQGSNVLADNVSEAMH